MRIGKITENALKRSVLKLIRTEYKNVKSAAVGSDCAFPNDERCASTVCSVTYGISDGAYYAVAKAVNALIAQGLTPDHFTVSILLPADVEERQLKDIVRDAIEAGKFLEVPYAGGHTEVTTAVNRPVITVHAVGYPMLKGAALGGAGLICNSKPHAGQALIVTKWIALEGTAILANEKKAELATRYPVPFIEDAIAFKRLVDVRQEAEAVAEFLSSPAPREHEAKFLSSSAQLDVEAEFLSSSASQDAEAESLSSPASQALEAGPEEKSLSVHDISSGGIFAALWEMAERAGCGLEANLRAIPIRQETIEVCEFLGVNPYLLTSAGSLLIACDHEEELLERLAERGISAAVIGHLREGNERILHNDDETRFLDMPQTDELVKVFS